MHQLQDLAEQAGVSLVHLALALVLEHPAVTSAIIRRAPSNTSSRSSTS